MKVTVVLDAEETGTESIIGVYRGSSAKAKERLARDLKEMDPELTLTAARSAVEDRYQFEETHVE